MMRNRIFLFVAIFAFSGIATFLLLKPNLKKQSEKALLFFRNGNYAEAEKYLKKVAHGEHLLCRAYLEQARGHLVYSEKLLQNALREYKKAGDPKLLCEAFLARALNAYLEGRENEFHLYVKEAEKLCVSSPYLDFFKGLHLYMQESYGEALKLWERISLQKEQGWLGTVLMREFSTNWFKAHRAHCLIEQGDYNGGRSLLEFEGIASLEDPLSPLFLGLSYLKEGQKLDCRLAEPFYQMAHFYFQRTPNLDGYPKERGRVIRQVEIAAESLLRDQIGHLQGGADCLCILADWKAEEAILRLADRLVARLSDKSTCLSLELCKKLQSMCSETPFYPLFLKKVENALYLALQQKDAETFFNLWDIASTLSISPSSSQEIKTLIVEEMFEIVRQDKSDLAHTKRLLALWETLEGNPQQKEKLANDLLTYAAHYWHNETQEGKGILLMEIALSLCNKAPCVQDKITNFLAGLYAQAESSHMIRRLTLIYDAMERFSLGRQEPVSKATLANHIADAEYLFEVRNYPAAKLHAQWILRLKPDDEKAHRLAGLSSFHLCDYAQALCHLQNVSDLKEDEQQVLMLSVAFAAQEELKHLCQGALSFDEEDLEP